MIQQNQNIVLESILMENVMYYVQQIGILLTIKINAIMEKLNVKLDHFMINLVIFHV